MTLEFTTTAEQLKAQLMGVVAEFEKGVQDGLNDGAQVIVDEKHNEQQVIYDRGPAPGAKAHTHQLYDNVTVIEEDDTRIIGNRGPSEAYEERNTDLPDSPRDGINRSNRAAEVAAEKGERPAFEAMERRIAKVFK